MRARRRGGHDRDERGAVLVLALVLLTAVGLTIGAMMSLVQVNLRSTTKLGEQRGIEFAANAAVDGAIQAVRHQAPDSMTAPTCPAFPKAPSSSLTVGGSAVIVRCSMGIPNGLYGRIVEFDACTPSTPNYAACKSSAIVRATVLFNDVASGCSSGALPGCTAWGTAVTLKSWVVTTANGA